MIKNDPTITVPHCAAAPAKRGLEVSMSPEEQMEAAFEETEREKALMSKAAYMQEILDQRIKERRERIATAAFAGIVAADKMLAGDHNDTWEKIAARRALEYADALITALDAKDTP